MRDLFNGAAHPSAASEIDSFRCIGSVFSGDGAVEVIKRSNGLKTFYPIRRKLNGEYVALWRSYLFVEFKKGVTINLCRTTANFIKVISERGEDGLLRPVLVRKNAIDESLRLMTQGKFDDVTFQGRFFGKGSIVRVIDGTFIDKKVRLEEDVFPDWRGNRKVKLDIDGFKGTIEVYKLAL
jgi:transcription antitermination factor NusG